jgi:hypothetical protein
VIMPPYCGTPNLSHHLPVVAVGVVVGLVVGVVVSVVAGFVVGVVVLVGVDLAQDVSSMAANIKQLKPSRITFFFILPPFFTILINYSSHCNTQ